MKVSSFFYSFLILLYNEKNSPEILPYDFSLVHFFWEIMSYQMNLMNLQDSKREKFRFSLGIKKIELDRIIYVLKSYHRYRIWKIEKEINSGNEQKNFNHCNLDERMFIETYDSINLVYNSHLFSKFIPQVLKNKIPRGVSCSGITSNEIPFMVFFRVLKKRKFVKENILLVEEPMKFYGEAVYSMKFNSIKKLLASGVIHLI